MKKIKAIVVLTILFLTFSRMIKAASNKSLTFKEVNHLGVFHNFWSNTVDSFIGRNLWYHGSAIGSTFVIVGSGADQKIQDYFQKDPTGDFYAISSNILGAIWQPVIGGILYFQPNNEVKTAGAAVLQAAIINFSTTGLLKFLTGRPDPVEGNDLANKEDGFCGNSSNSKEFFKVGKCTFPSGHSSSSFSLISTLFAFYPKKTWIAYLGYPIALAIGIGMVEADEHWFSDIIFGAIMGHAIGWTIGTNFRRDFNQLSATETQKYSFNFFISTQKTGFTYTFRF